MSKPARRISRLLLWTAAVLAIAGLVVPLIRVNRFRNQIRIALENALGRKVEIGEVTLTLLPVPGFQMGNLVVGEDPAFGFEHFVYATSVQARPRWRALWTGQVQLASLTLIDPSINLAKNRQGRWNFEALLERSGRGAASGPVRTRAPANDAYFPYIGIESGRINFKFGDYKSVFHIQEAEAALSPPRDAGGRWKLRFAGRLARTDRLLSGMGRLTGEGTLGLGEGSGAEGRARRIQVDLALETSPMAHLITLVYGRDFGVHGEIGAQAHLSGEISQIQVQGALQVRDVHRWDLVPANEGGISVPFLGRLNLPQQHLELQTAASESAPIPVRVRFALQDYLNAPVWKASVELRQAPADPFVRAAQHLGAPLPAGLEVRGLVSGVLDFPGSVLPQGRLQLGELRVSLPGCPPMEFGPIQARLDGPVFDLLPVEMRLVKEVLRVEAAGRLDRFALSSRITARGVRLEALRQPAECFKLAWLHSLSSGLWEGEFVYRKEPGEPGGWTGSGTLSEARWQPPGLESPVEITQANVRWNPREVVLDYMTGSLGETRFTGSYRRLAAERAAERGDRCRLRLAELDLARLDQWLNPQRKPSLWAVWRRALGRNVPETPSWLRAAKVEGAVTVGELRLGKWSFRNVRSALSWNGEVLALKGLRAELGGGAVTGAFRAEFVGAVPRYSFQAAVSGLDLKGLAGSSALPSNFRRGSMDLRVELATAGRTAQDLHAALKAAGAFEGRAILLGNIERQDEAGDAESTVEIRSLRGRFELARDRLQLTGLLMTVGREIYQGVGTIGGQPQVLFELAAEGKQLRLVGAADETPAVP
ncbi:MAG: AsmA family protein [Acidobacteria bacterium]|nr:AsmA family protein [Acidobacteriota bacterium]